MNGVYVIIAIEDLSYSILKLIISCPSNSICPLYKFCILNKAWIMLDLPAPVLPTQHIFYPGSILNDKSSNTKSYLSS